MGSFTSRMVSPPSHGAGPRKRRRSTSQRSFSSFLICGAPSSTREMEDHSAELLVNSAELGNGEKLKYKKSSSDISYRVSSGRCLTANENQALETRPSNIGPGDEGKHLSGIREIFPCEAMVISRVDDTASTSCVDPLLPDGVCATEILNIDAVKDVNGNMNEDSSQIVEALSNSSCLYHGPTESLFDEVSVENEVIDFSDSEYGHSVVSGSPIEFHLTRGDSLQEVIPSAIGFILPGREQYRQERSLIQGDLIGASSTTLSRSSSGRSNWDATRTSQRLFWDAFSRRSPGRDSVSRSLLLSSDESDYLISQNRLLLDVSGDFISNERRGDIRSRESRTESSNEQRWNSRSEILGRFRNGLDSTDHQTTVCPTRIHADGLCSCLSALPTDESDTHAISRIVLLAQALFEVLDHMHREPILLSLPRASLPAPESVIDSFPVKIHRKEYILECAEDVTQCYICLADYEEGDKIRVLPCYHEYHMSCVDKWLHEFHGVCPLCRGDVCQGLPEASVSDREILSH